MAKKPTPEQPPRPPRRRFRRLAVISILILLVLSLAGAAALVGGYLYISQDLPRISSLRDYRPAIISTVFDENHRMIAEFFRERRVVVGLPEVPPLLVKAFVAAEDSRFYQHQGVDPFSILRAALKNLEAGTIKQGGSTITQQVTRSFLLTPERSYIRKIKEVILSYRIEKDFSKEEILFLYLNQIYLGHGAYGVQAAAENYFGKSGQGPEPGRVRRFWPACPRRRRAIRLSATPNRRGRARCTCSTAWSRRAPSPARRPTRPSR